MNFIGTGLRELGLKVRRQRTRMALRHVKRQLQRSEIALGREGTAQAASFPEVEHYSFITPGASSRTDLIAKHQLPTGRTATEIDFDNQEA